MEIKWVARGIVQIDNSRINVREFPKDSPYNKCCDVRKAMHAYLTIRNPNLKPVEIDKLARQLIQAKINELKSVMIQNSMQA